MTTLKMSAERNVRQSTKIISYPMKQTQAMLKRNCQPNLGRMVNVTGAGVQPTV